jgi:hypothetical protein
VDDDSPTTAKVLKFTLEDELNLKNDENPREKLSRDTILVN